MKIEQLNELIEQTDARYILEAEPEETKRNAKRKRTALLALILAAALVTTAAAVTLGVVLTRKDDTPPLEEEPVAAAHTSGGEKPSATSSLPSGTPFTQTADETPVAPTATETPVMTTDEPTVEPAREIKAIVYLDVNPGLRLEVDANGMVIGLAGTNDDGRELLELYRTADESAEKTVGALIGLMTKVRYLKDKGTVLLSVVSDDRAYASRLRETVEKAANDALQAQGVESEVIAQELEEDGFVEILAAAYRISEGKAALILELLSKGCESSLVQLAKDDLENIVRLCREYGIDEVGFRDVSITPDEYLEQVLNAGQSGWEGLNDRIVILQGPELWNTDKELCVDMDKDRIFILPFITIAGSDDGYRLDFDESETVQVLTFWCDGVMHVWSCNGWDGLQITETTFETVSPPAALLRVMEDCGVTRGSVRASVLFFTTDCYMIELYTFDERYINYLMYVDGSTKLLGERAMVQLDYDYLEKYGI